jgi:hypothetical protein
LIDGDPRRLLRADHEDVFSGRGLHRHRPPGTITGVDDERANGESTIMGCRADSES